MRVVQLLTTLSFGDAVSNDTLALGKVIREMGHDTGIYAENIDPRLPKGSAQHVREMKFLRPDDLLIYHKSTGTDLSFRLQDHPCRKLMIYHNITPPAFFEPYILEAAALTRYGLEGVTYLKDKVDAVMGDSEFNLSNLRDMGYTCPMMVRPILIPFEDYAKKPDEAIVREMTKDGWTNIVFVGHIAPNKRQEDLIRTFAVYKKMNARSRLILVGSWTGMENYYERLRTYAQALGLEDVVFTGHIPFAQILAYYHSASVFLCMSAHEGFCVPLAEAMYFRVPIIAYSACAVPDTLGGSGLLLTRNDPTEAAMLIDRVMRDDALREAVIKGQDERLKDFSYDRIKALFTRQLTDVIRNA